MRLLLKMAIYDLIFLSLIVIRMPNIFGSNIEVSEGSANYMLYTIKANGLYTICMRVDNTLVFAYCNEENASKLNAIMIEIGYFDE